MGKLTTIGNIIIRVYANDHLPAHFHAVSPDFAVLIEIQTLAVYAGSMTPAGRKVVMPWAAANIALLKAEWNRINPNFPI